MSFMRQGRCISRPSYRKVRKGKQEWVKRHEAQKDVDDVHERGSIGLFSFELLYIKTHLDEVMIRTHNT